MFPCSEIEINCIRVTIILKIPKILNTNNVVMLSYYCCHVVILLLSYYCCHVVILHAKMFVVSRQV